MMSGVSAATFFEMFGHSIYDVYGSIINKYVASGHLKDEGGNIKLTTAGIDVSNVVLADFLLD
jgi:oxygen-independent coproporphyrinogen-3 oxidase